MPTLLTDLDGTVFEFTAHFERWAEENGYIFKKGILGQTYMFQDMFDQPIDVERFVADFFSCDRTFSTFAEFRDCVEPVQRLKARGWDFVGITACNDRPGMAALRAKNFEQVFGFELHDIHVTGYVGTKFDALESYEPTIWVEDNRYYAEMGSELGHRVFLLDHPYNQGKGDFTRVENWHEIEDILCAES